MPSVEEIHEAVACLQRLTDLFRQRRQSLAVSVGLTEQQWSVLEEIATEHFMPSLFARQSERSPAAISKVLRQLLDKDFIVVSLSPEDGRQRNYELSVTGSRVLSQLRRQREHAISEIWQHFDSVAVRKFSRFGGRLSERLEQYARTQSPSVVGHAEQENHARAPR